MALFLFISLLMVPHRCFSSSELKKNYCKKKFEEMTQI